MYMVLKDGKTVVAKTGSNLVVVGTSIEIYTTEEKVIQFDIRDIKYIYPGYPDRA